MDEGCRQVRPGAKLTNMTLWQGSKPELITATAAAIGLPFYLGFVHAAVPQLVLYSSVAGAAMATGEFAEQAHLKRGGFRLFITEAAVWAAVIALLGGATYLFALLF
jgi:hypothetical protein